MTMVDSFTKGHRRDIPKIAPQMLRWYDRQRRDLPWRAKQDAMPNPYHVFISEFMLQQTTVTVVIPYFQAFIKKWPTLKSLTRASLDEIRAAWAGLGYYRRAQFLYEAAHRIKTEHHGVIPREKSKLLQLPGFGIYTSAAVSAIAFDQPETVVDGNILRIMARLFAHDERLPKAKAMLTVYAEACGPKKKRHGDYAQALMDLGALVCRPHSPRCGECPLQKICLAHRNGSTEQYPKKKLKRKRPLRKATAFVIWNSKGHVFVEKRPEGGLLGGMLGVPMSDWSHSQTHNKRDARTKIQPTTLAWTPVPKTLQHVFTHFTLMVRIYVAKNHSGMKGRWLNPGSFHTLPSLMQKIVRLGSLEYSKKNSQESA